MASNKPLPVLPPRTSSGSGCHHTTSSEPSYQYMYEDPRSLWVHHHPKTPLGGISLGGGYRAPERCPPERSGQSSHQYGIEPLRTGRSGLGIRVSGHGCRPHQLRETSQMPPAYNNNSLLPPSPEDS